jgi:hypothetical protein
LLVGLPEGVGALYTTSNTPKTKAWNWTLEAMTADISRNIHHCQQCLRDNLRYSTTCFFIYRISTFPELLFLFWNKKFWEELIGCFLWYDTDHIENDECNNTYIAACVFVEALTFLSSRCVAIKVGIITEPLPSNEKELHI